MSCITLVLSKLVRSDLQHALPEMLRVSSDFEREDARRTESRKRSPDPKHLDPLAVETDAARGGGKRTLAKKRDCCWMPMRGGERRETFDARRRGGYEAREVVGWNRATQARPPALKLLFSGVDED